VDQNAEGQNKFQLEPLPRPTEEELAFLDSEQRIALRICMAFGVPLIKIMDLSQSSVLANTDVQERLYWEDTIPSLHCHFTNFLDQFAAKWYPKHGPVFFEYDYSGVRALKRSEKDQMDVMTGYKREGVLTANEVRESIGWAPVAKDDERYTEGLDQFLIGNQQLGRSPIASLFGPPSKPDDDDDDKPAPNPFDPDDDELEEEEDEDKVVRLRAKGFEHLAGGMIDLDEEKEIFDRKHRKKIHAMMRAAAEQTLDLSGVVGSFDALHPKVLEALDTQMIELSTQVLTNTNNAVRSAIADGLAQGDAIASMRNRVQDAFEVRREPAQLDRIARTEVHAAQEGGGQLAAEQNGVEMKQWVTSHDSRVRGLEANDKADHDGIEKNGPIPIGVPYQDPRSGAQLMFPGDRSGALSGADTINCRCASVPDFSHLELSARPDRLKSFDDQWDAKAERALVWERDFIRTLRSYFIGMQRRALARFDELIHEGEPTDASAASS